MATPKATTAPTIGAVAAAFDVPNPSALFSVVTGTPWSPPVTLVPPPDDLQDTRLKASVSREMYSTEKRAPA